MSGCNSVALQRAAMKLQIWKLEDHSLQHMSSDQFTLVAYLISYTSVQQTINIQDSPLNQLVCIMECHDSMRAKRLTCSHASTCGNCITSAPSGFHCISLQLSAAKLESGEKTVNLGTPPGNAKSLLWS